MAGPIEVMVPGIAHPITVANDQEARQILEQLRKTESPLEREFLSQLIWWWDRGEAEQTCAGKESVGPFTNFVTQYEIGQGNGILAGPYRVDLAHLPTRLIVEVDGYTYHCDEEQFDAGRRRDVTLFEVAPVFWTAG